MKISELQGQQCLRIYPPIGLGLITGTAFAEIGVNGVRLIHEDGTATEPRPLTAKGKQDIDDNKFSYLNLVSYCQGDLTEIGRD